MDKFRFQFLGCLILLVGTILSNAYKNDNVYNMVVPRKPVLYSEFSELVRDNFKIYTKSFKVNFEQSFKNIPPGSTVLHASLPNISFYIKTELEALAGKRVTNYFQETKIFFFTETGYPNCYIIASSCDIYG